MSDSKMLEMKIADFNGKVSELWDTLMGLELQLVDQLEVRFISGSFHPATVHCTNYCMTPTTAVQLQDAVKDFERNLADMVSAFLEHVQGLTSQLRDLENQHNEKMLEVAVITLEKVVKNELDDDISDDLREVCDIHENESLLSWKLSLSCRVPQQLFS